MLALLIVVTVASSLISAGFCAAGYFFPGFIVRDGESTHTSRVFALYALARSAALVLVILWAAFRADGAALIWLGALLGIVELLDAAIGLQAGKRSATWGPLAVGMAQLTVVLLAVLFGV
jgi:hypothetical protein